MKEKELLDRATVSLSTIYPGCAIWRAPAFKLLRWDVFGIFDLVVATKTGEVLFIQVTTAPNLSARRKKIQNFFDKHSFVIPNASIWSWGKRKMSRVESRQFNHAIFPGQEIEVPVRDYHFTIEKF